MTVVVHNSVYQSEFYVRAGDLFLPPRLFTQKVRIRVHAYHAICNGC